ncbi:MAG TPA: SPOR domain-containing protein [Caldimonas sp.]|jgi:DedD protein|nr:SPOR domain-containing protein [Caldimonas sp.]HEX4234978.1 SPOR domain-containing protein [Caldimonas sp.]
MFKQKRDSAPDKPRIEPADAVQQARTRARRRLIGAIVLLVIGIIGFPLVFETQPRPIPVDVPIEIPRRDALPPLAMPPPRSTPTRPAAPTIEPAATTDAAPTAPGPATPRTAPATTRGSDGVVPGSSGDAGHDIGAARATAHASSATETPRRAASAAVVAVAPASTATRSADGERARALLEGHPASGADDQRFVVQVGAFADAEAARETRKNVEKLGLKTYTQVAQTSAGNRIRVRVGPFATRGEAEAALAKAKAAGMNAVLLTL